MAFTHAAAWIADLIVVLTLVAALGRQLRTGIAILAVEGVLLATLTAAQEGWRAMPTVLLLLAFKALILPGVLAWVALRLGAYQLREEGSRWGYPAMLGVILAVARLDPGPAGFLHGEAHHLVVSGLVICLAGLVSLVTHQQLLNQVTGLALAENGLYVAGLGLTGGLPSILDMAIFLDLTSALLFLVWLTVHIRQQLGHLDVDRLNQLRG